MADTKMTDDTIVQVPYRTLRRLERIATIAPGIATGALLFLLVVLVAAGRGYCLVNPTHEAQMYRDRGLSFCSMGEYVACVDSLDTARTFEKSSDDRPDVRAARDQAKLVSDWRRSYRKRASGPGTTP